MKKPLAYALSIKQPWAALLVHGRKSIEVRRWPTARRGPILIHAARVPDDRAEAWALVPDEVREAASQTGGIIGQAELVECRAYRSVEAFKADQVHHLNDPLWFQPPQLFGFVFSRVEPVAFRPYPGWLRFFPVDEGQLPASRRTRVDEVRQETLFD